MFKKFSSQIIFFQAVAQNFFSAFQCKKIIVSDEGREKVVKVIIKEDGKENIEVYEGKAAEEYLEKLESEKEIEVNVDIKGKDCKKIKNIIIEKGEKTE